MKCFNIFKVSPFKIYVQVKSQNFILYCSLFAVRKLFSQQPIWQNSHVHQVRNMFVNAFRCLSSMSLFMNYNTQLLNKNIHIFHLKFVYENIFLIISVQIYSIWTSGQTIIQTSLINAIQTFLSRT